MFAYELQRQSDVESLFQGSLFRIAQQDEVSSSHESRIAQLERSLRATQAELQLHDIVANLATCKTRVSAQQNLINACAAKLEAHGTRLAEVNREIEGFAAARAEGANLTTKVKELVTELTTSREEVDTLFGERDAMITMLQESGTRISKLEDLVRSLTLQLSMGSASPSNGSSSPAMAQRVPLTFSNGQTVELEIPKGRPLVGVTREKGNRTFAGKTFVPGQAFVSGQDIKVSHAGGW